MCHLCHQEGQQLTLQHEAAKGNVAMCKKLIEQHGADVNEKISYCLTVEDNKVFRTALHLSAEAGHLEVCELFIKHGANVNAKARIDFTPLHLAATAGHTEVCELLIRHGADVKAKDKFGHTPLNRAEMENNNDVCKLLLEYEEGEDVAIKSNPISEIDAMFDWMASEARM